MNKKLKDVIIREDDDIMIWNATTKELFYEGTYCGLYGDLEICEGYRVENVISGNSVLEVKALDSGIQQVVGEIYRGEHKRQLTEDLYCWNYTDEEIYNGYKYCEENNIDINGLKNYEFEEIVIKVNEITYPTWVEEK